MIGFKAERGTHCRPLSPLHKASFSSQPDILPQPPENTRLLPLCISSIEGHHAAIVTLVLPIIYCVIFIIPLDLYKPQRTPIKQEW